MNIPPNALNFADHFAAPQPPVAAVPAATIDRLQTLANRLQAQPAQWGLRLRGNRAEDTRRLLAEVCNAEAPEHLIARHRQLLDHDLAILREQQNRADNPLSLYRIEHIESAIDALHQCRDRLEAALSSKQTGLQMRNGEYDIGTLLDDARLERVAQRQRRIPPQPGNVPHAPQIQPQAMAGEEMIAEFNPHLQRAMTTAHRAVLTESLAHIARAINGQHRPDASFYAWFAVRAILSARDLSAPGLTIEQFENHRSEPAADHLGIWRDTLYNHLHPEEQLIYVARGMVQAVDERERIDALGVIFRLPQVIAPEPLQAPHEDEWDLVGTPPHN